MKKKCSILIIAFAIMVSMNNSCRKPFSIPEASGTNRFLVVDGFINNGTDTIMVKLSRSRTIGDSTPFGIETGAHVMVSSQDGSSYQMLEISPGLYMTDQVLFDSTKKYQLSISTVSNRQYLSDWVNARKSPPIDSVTWRYTPDGVSFFVNTHDPNNNSRNYRWEYQETWEYTSNYSSDLRYEAGLIVTVDSSEFFYRCWQTSKSDRILLASSSGLSQDVIFQKPLTDVPIGSQKMGIRYSLLVTQYSLTDEAFNFWDNLSKNTEGRGTIFDALPSEIIGNIHCQSDPSEPVIGFLSAGVASTARIFIDSADVPQWNYHFPDCPTILVANNPDSTRKYYSDGLYIPYYKKYAGVGVVGFYSAMNYCVDCRMAGGVTNRPPYWPN